MSLSRKWVCDKGGALIYYKKGNSPRKKSILLFLSYELLKRNEVKEEERIVIMIG
jgi:hypothetical protein